VLLRDPTTVEAEDLGLLQRLRQDGEVEQARDRAQRFRKRVRERVQAEFVPWLQDTLGNGLPELRSVAADLQRAQAAIQAAREMPSNNGHIEGQVTQWKLLKRQGCGRAKLDVLRQRMRYAA
jgi:transposase